MARHEYARGPIGEPDYGRSPVERRQNFRLQKLLKGVKKRKHKKEYGRAELRPNDPAVASLESAIKDLPPSFPTATQKVLRALITG